VSAQGMFAARLYRRRSVDAVEQGLGRIRGRGDAVTTADAETP
jgi:hypothetical protein